MASHPYIALKAEADVSSSLFKIKKGPRSKIRLLLLSVVSFSLVLVVMRSRGSGDFARVQANILSVVAPHQLNVQNQCVHIASETRLVPNF